MDKLFLTILNMSLTGAFVISAICLARLPLKKAPKIISYCLWAVAGFRLAFPFSIESVFSLIPFKAAPIPPDIVTQTVPRIDSGIPFVNNALSGILPAAEPAAGASPLQIWTAIGAYVWLAVAALMLIYGAVSFMILKRKLHDAHEISLDNCYALHSKMRGAAHVEANIYEADHIKSPFVLGVFKPRIYLPAGLSERERGCVIRHELTHIRRRDHIVKFAAYFVLCLHWFNPLAWVAFLLMGVDMEMSCDERVLKEMGGGRPAGSGAKRDYSLSLLSLATERRFVGGSPLAFSEGGIKERIKNVLNFRRPSRVIVIAAVALVAVLSVGFAVSRAGGAVNTDSWESYDFPTEKYNGVFFECNDSPYNPEYISISAQLMNNQNVQGLTCGEIFTLVKQVGDSWKVVPFADNMFFNLPAYLLDSGGSFDYTVRPEMLAVKLSEGQYRIVTDISQHVTEGEDPIIHTVWADFTIDRNAPEQESFSLPGDWMGNLDGREMTVDEMKQTANSYVKMGRYLTIDDLSQYKSMNFSSNTNSYMMLYSVEGGLSLHANADSTRIIRSMSIRRIADSETLTIDANSLEFLDDFINGIYTPTVPLQQTQNRSLQVSAYPNPYTPLMSSSPGMRIEVSYDAPYTNVQYHAEFGEYITWSGGVVTQLGNDVTVLKDTMVYWTPAQGSYSGDTVTVTILGGDNQLAEAVFPITYDGEGIWYNIDLTPGYTPSPTALKKGNVSIELLSDATGPRSVYTIEVDDPEVAQTIFSALDPYKDSSRKMVPDDDLAGGKINLQNGSTNLYRIVRTYDYGGIESVGIYYDTKREKAYLTGPSVLYELEIDFARYIDALFPVAAPGKFIPLPDFTPQHWDDVYTGDGIYGDLFYSAIMQQYGGSGDDFMVYAPTLYGVYKESGKLVAFVTVYYEHYRLRDNTLTSTAGAIIPGAIIFSGDTDSDVWVPWEFESYIEIGASPGYPDGGYFDDSIRKMCVMPVSGKSIPGLADKILNDYTDHTARHTLLMQSLKEHLLQYGLTGVSLQKPDGNLESLT